MNEFDWASQYEKHFEPTAGLGWSGLFFFALTAAFFGGCVMLATVVLLEGVIAASVIDIAPPVVLLSWVFIVPVMVFWDRKKALTGLLHSDDAVRWGMVRRISDSGNPVWIFSGVRSAFLVARDGGNEKIAQAKAAAAQEVREVAAINALREGSCWYRVQCTFGTTLDAYLGDLSELIVVFNDFERCFQCLGFKTLDRLYNALINAMEADEKMVGVRRFPLPSVHSEEEMLREILLLMLWRQVSLPFPIPNKYYR